MDEPDGTDKPAAGHRWIILLIGLVAMTAGCTFQYGLAYLIPALRQQGLSLELASTLVACPTAGLLLTLIAWGAAADRWGERVVLAAGLGLAGAVLIIASSVHAAAGLGLCLAVGGAAGGSVFAASGRLILGWFARHERGLAMASGRARSRWESRWQRPRCPPSVAAVGGQLRHCCSSAGFACWLRRSWWRSCAIRLDRMPRRR
jgi:MFS family permease